MSDRTLEQMVEAVVREVVAGLSASGGSAALRDPSQPSDDVLALFTGGYAHIEEIAAAFRSLAKAGCTVKAILSPAARAVMGEPGGAEKLGVQTILSQEYPVAFVPLVTGFKAIVLPTLTRTTAAKLAWGICDTVITNAVYVALAQKIPVIGVTDSLSMEEDCAECGNVLPYVRGIISDYADRLGQLGLRLIKADRMETELLGMLKAGGSTTEPVHRDVITLADIRRLESETIRVARGTIITPLARDHLRDQGVTIQFVED